MDILLAVKDVMRRNLRCENNISANENNIGSLLLIYTRASKA